MISRAPLRRRIATLVALLATAAVVATSATTSVASWTDTEYVNGATAAMLCTDAGSGTSVGSGRLIGGQLGALDLGSVAAVEGERVVNSGSGSTPTPSGSTSLGGDSYANPLQVSALSTINAGLGGALVIPAGVDAGVLNQWARATPDTKSAGATGAVLNTGAISLTPPANGTGLPRFATLKLGSVLQAVLGSSVSSLVTNLTDIDLGIGAVASDATLDGCRANWDGIYTALVRQYAIAGLEATLTSPAASALASDTTSALNSLSSQITTIAGSSGLVNSLSSAVLGQLGSITALVGLGTPTATVTITPDFSAVTALVNGTISDSGHLLSISPAAGTIIVDLDALLGPAYLSSPQLNGLAPNSALLLNAAAVTALQTAITTALASWVTSVIGAVNAALTAPTVRVTLSYPVTLASTQIATLAIDTGSVSLAALAAGTTSTSMTITALGTCVPLVTCPVIASVNALLTGTLKTAVGVAIGGTLQSALAGLATTVTALNTTLGTDSSTLVAFLGSSLSTLFGASGLVSLVANAQNAPDPAIPNEGVPPSWAVSLPGPTANPDATGQYDVAALRLVVLGAAPAVSLGLDLARSSVGPNTEVG